MAMRYLTRWAGEPADMLDLLQVVQRNCTCSFSDSGAVERVCSAHALLTGDQQTINRLTFVRSIADRLRAEEWSPANWTSTNVDCERGDSHARD
jgi:hypothetical protein